MTEDNTTEEVVDGGEATTETKAPKAKPARKPRKKAAAKSTPKEETVETPVSDSGLEKAFVPRSPITDPPPARPSIMRVQILKNAGGYFRGELHDLQLEIAEDLLRRKIAIRVL